MNVPIVDDLGERNDIIVEGVTGGQLRLTVKGSDSTVRIRGLRVRNSLNITANSNSSVIVSDATLNGRVIAANGAAVEIGAGTTVEHFYLSAMERRSIKIGAYCMMASGIVIRTSDAHPIFDLETGDRVNSAADVEIGDHVWLAQGATILKGSKIPDGCIVAAQSTVTGSRFEKNSLLAGTPARQIRTGVTWNRFYAQSLSDEANWDEYNAQFR